MMPRPAPTSASLSRLGIGELLAGYDSGSFTPLDIVESCLERIAVRERHVGAWAELDQDFARTQANRGRSSDEPLFGIPFAAKDVFDTADLTTEIGSALYRGHRPRFDAGVVGQLRMAGAILLGKTVTAEFAGTRPTATSNPLRLSHTPGGSSSGSAAAVADFMVPFALGTQTGGSVLRPAAFCGVVGFKPSFGLYSPAGMKIAAHSFDTVGLITRCVGDVARVHAALMNETPAQRRTAPLRIGLIRTHLWKTVTDDSRAALDLAATAARGVGAQIHEVLPPDGFDTITERRAIINAFERARGLAAEWAREREAMSPQSMDICRRGFATRGEEYVAARRAVAAFQRNFGQLFDEVDILLTPVTPGEAPYGNSHAGDPRLQELWTMLHLPSITLPVTRGANGLPVGIQLVGPQLSDREFLGAAELLETALLATA